MRRRSFRNSIWREGERADSGSSKMKMPWRWQRSSKKRRKPSPCEWERKSGGGPLPGSLAASFEVARDREEALRPEEPAVGDFRQPGRLQRLGQEAAGGFDRERMISGHVALAAPGLVVAG